jgi:riboflavin kinase/FMN adenylyltransferase
MTTPHTHPPATTVIGEFDSFHVGHRNLVCAAKRIAERNRTALNALVLYDDSVTAVTTVDQRLEHLVDAGAVTVTVVDASSGDAEVAAVRAIDVARTRVAVMACAPSRTTDLKWPNLRTILRRASVEIVEVERAVDEHGAPITSDLVRHHLAAGDVSYVASLLGSTFTVKGLVRHGDARGRTIGFPTANLPQDAATLWPAFGVYGAWVDVDGDRHRAAVNIGTRPTVYGASGVPLLEAHLLDFSGDLYDREIEVHFVERIRGEQRFDSLAALTARLATDVDLTRELVAIPES